MDINLVNLEEPSKAIIALIDAVSRGIGTLYEPRRIRKNADAKAYEMQTLAEAEKRKTKYYQLQKIKQVKLLPKSNCKR